jgi:hypothetical protein
MDPTTFKNGFRIKFDTIFRDRESHGRIGYCLAERKMFCNASDFILDGCRPIRFSIWNYYIEIICIYLNLMQYCI